MISFAICDDSPADIRFLSECVRGWAQKKGETVRLESFSSAEAFLFRYEENKAYDILLLDIEMGGMNGVELAKQVRRENEAVQMVFITGYSDYIAEGYEVAALHYLMKPIRPEKLWEILDRAVVKCRQIERSLLLETSGETARIPLPEIRYLEVRRNYVTVHGRREYTVKRTLSELERELDERFFRIGRSLIVNLHFVRRVTKNDVYLADGTALPLPRGMYEPLNRAIINGN